MAGRKSSASNIKMQSVDALFGLEQDKGSPAEKVVDVAIDKLYPFNSHPFRVLDDEKMQETVESVREHGIIVAAHLFWLQINLIDCHRINRYNDISIEKEKVPEHLFFCRDKCSGTIYKHGYYIKIRNRIQ